MDKKIWQLVANSGEWEKHETGVSVGFSLVLSLAFSSCFHVEAWEEKY